MSLDILGNRISEYLIQ